MGIGNVIAGFVHEATDEAWKSYDTGKVEDGHFGVLGKPAESVLRESILARAEFGKVMPLTDAPRELVRGAAELLDRHDYGYAMGYALRAIDLYGKEARNQSRELQRLGGDRRMDGQAAKMYWALDTVGSAYFLLGRVWYEMNDKARARRMFDLLRSKYSAACIRDRNGRYWRLTKAVRALFPDLSKPYFSAGLRSMLTFSLLCLLLIVSNSISAGVSGAVRCTITALKWIAGRGAPCPEVKVHYQRASGRIGRQGHSAAARAGLVDAIVQVCGLVVSSDQT